MGQHNIEAPKNLPFPALHAGSMPAHSWGEPMMPIRIELPWSDERLAAASRHWAGAHNLERLRWAGSAEIFLWDNLRPALGRFCPCALPARCLSPSATLGAGKLLRLAVRQRRAKAAPWHGALFDAAKSPLLDWVFPTGSTKDDPCAVTPDTA